MVNETQLILAAVLMAVVVAAALWWLPAKLKALIAYLDHWIPGDFTAMANWLSWLGTLTIVGLVLFGGGLSMANATGADTSSIVGELEGFGTGIGEWVLDRVLKIAVIAAIAAILVQAIRRGIPSVIREHVAARMGPDDRPDESPGEVQKRANTLTNVVVRSLEVIVVATAGFMALLEFGFNLAPLLAAAGVVGLAIGFGAQSLIKDILAGLFILWEDQFRVGDVVNIAGVGGLVEDINLRRTVLRDLEFVVHIIPNGEIRVASNRTKQKSRMMVDVGVAYRTDLDQAIAVINQLGQEIQDDPEWGPIIRDQIKVLRIDEFADSAINVRVLGETLPLRQWDVAGEFRRRLKRRFDEVGIEIPFPHMTVYWGEDQPPMPGQPARKVEAPSRLPQEARGPIKEEELSSLAGESPEEDGAD